MTVQSPSLGRSLSFLTAPRSIRTVLAVSLLPLIILPVLLGYWRYAQVQNELFQQTSTEINKNAGTTVAAINAWQKNGVDQLTSLSGDPDLVAAVATFQQSPTKANSDQVFAVIRSKPSTAQAFTDFAIVETDSKNIIAASNSLWVGHAFPVTTGGSWFFPFAHMIFNQAPFGENTMQFMVASPIRSGTETTSVLVGALNLEDLSTILASSKNTPPDSYMYLVDMAAGWKAYRDSTGIFRVEILPQIQSTLINELATGEVKSYTNIFNTPVLGQSQQVLDTGTRLLVEENAQQVSGPLNAAGTMGLISGIGLILAAGFAGVTIWFLIARPMIRLSRATGRIASGQADEAAPTLATSEFIELSDSLRKAVRSYRDISKYMGADGQLATRKLMATAELTQTLAGVAYSSDVLRLVVKFVADRLRINFAAIYLIDEGGQFAVLREATGQIGERIKEQGQRFPLGSYTIIGSVAQTGRSYVAPNTAEDPMYVRNDLLPDTRSEAAIAISVDRHVIGVLDVHATTPNAFSAEDLDMLQAIVDQTGLSIESVKIIETANINTDISQQLFRTSRMISMVAKPEEIYTAALDGLRGTTYIVAILTVEEDHLRVKGFYDPTSPQADKSPVDIINDPVDTFAHLLPSSQPVVLKVLSELSRLPVQMRHFLESLGCRMAGFLPLRQGDKLIGAILLASHDETALTITRVRAYMPVVEQILIAMERLDLIHSTQERLTELVTLNRVSQSISQALDIEALFDSVHEQTRSAIGECDIIFALYDQNRDLLNFPYAFLGDRLVQIETAPLGDSLYATVIHTGQPLMLVQNLEERANALGVRLSEPSLKSWMGIPLISGNQIVGVMALRDTERENRFHENDLRLMVTIGAQIASTIRTSTLLLESERKAIQLQTAAEIARETIGLLTLDRLLSISVNLIRDRFGFYHASVFLVDNEHKFAILNESTGEAGRQMKSRGHKLGVGSQSIVGWVTQNARPRVADDVTADPMHKPNPLLPATRSELGIPMKIGDSVIGALDIQSTTPYAFTPDDIAILQVIADQITIAVENARLFSQTREYLTRHQSLYQVTASAAAATTVESALMSAAQGLHDTIPGSRVGIFLLNPEKDALLIRAHVGFASREIGNLRIPVGQGVAGWVAIHRQPSLVANTATDSRYLMIDSDVQSELAIPLIHRDELLGVLDTQSSHLAAFSEDDVQLLGTVASLLSAILSSTLLFEQVTEERERLRHLYEEAIGMAGPPAGSMDNHLRNAIERVRTVSGADCVALAFPSGPAEARIEMCTCEPNFRHLAGTMVHYGQEVLGTVFSTSQVVHYAPATGVGEISKMLAQFGIKSAIALPMQWSGRMLGALLVSRMTSEREFSNEETQLVSLLALQLAATIESARLFEQTRRQAEREHMLFEITSRIRRSVDVQGILSTTASELSKALGARHATIRIGGAGTTVVETESTASKS